MTQAYPQFTPVQILEAGRRAMSDGRAEYASQFFQHLIDHYGNHPEAAEARDAMAQLRVDQEVQVSSYQPAANGYNGTPGGQGAHGGQNGIAHGGQNGGHYGAPPPKAMYPNGAAARPGGIQLSVNPAPQPGYNGAPSGHNAGQQAGYHHPVHQRIEPDLGSTSAAAIEMPRHIARQSPNYQPDAAPAPHRFVPAPEKNYIIGRVIAGLLLLTGILGVFAAIPVLFAAITAPAIFVQLGIGISQPVHALVFASALFGASLAVLIAAQIATALFNAADAAADLVRLERFRAGDYDAEEADE